MRVKVCDITSDGIEIEESLNQSILELNPKDYIYFIEPLKVHARFDRYDDIVLGKFKVESRFKTSCARSLEPLELDWHQEFTADWELERNTEFIELDDDIRQEVLMALPLRVVSKDHIEEEVDVNSSDADSTQENTDPPVRTYQPFADLKDIE